MEQSERVEMSGGRAGRTVTLSGRAYAWVKGLRRNVGRGLLILSVLAPLSACSQDQNWEMVESMIERDFPDVKNISTDSLAAWIADTDREPPVLIDVRASDEYNVSHLDGAFRIDPDATTFPELDSLDRDRPIVAYCSVGYRSSQMAVRLTEAGFTDVRNLDGSIFRWANEGKPVVRDGKEVEVVHPYDRLWGRLLNDSLHAEEE